MDPRIVHFAIISHPDRNRSILEQEWLEREFSEFVRMHPVLNESALRLNDQIKYLAHVVFWSPNEPIPSEIYSFMTEGLTVPETADKIVAWTREAIAKADEELALLKKVIG